MYTQWLNIFLAAGFLMSTAQAAEPYLFKTKEPQQLTILNTGSLSFYKRLEMIEKAKKTIETEFFIWNIDEAGRLFTQALVKKARQGVKVRVLIDYGWPLAKLDSFYATLLAENGVEVRYYNPSISFELFKGQFRSHRKALIVDDIEGMTGGRNIADEYFDMSEEYNFIDRDIHVRGSVAKAMRYSFDSFWSSKLTEPPRVEKEPNPEHYGVSTVADIANYGEGSRYYDGVRRRYDDGMKKANAYLLETEKDRSTLKSLKAMGEKNASELRPHTCTDTVFAADMPGIGKKSRVLFDEISAQMKNVRKSVYIESPYFVTTTNGMDYIRSFLKNGIDIHVYTNSLNSTDAIYTTATFYPRVGSLIQDGMKVFIYKGASLPGQDYFNDKIKNARWGIHAKTAVLDERVTMVGTFNVDPRSRNINAEMAIICRDSEALAAEVISNIKAHEQLSVQLGNDGKPVDGTSKFESVSLTKRILYHLSSPLANVFDFLL